MLTMDLPELPAGDRLYCFAGVEVDTERLQLRVDGLPIACSRKAFELLVLLCRSPHTVLPRTRVMDALWPGGQTVSDEALTQIIFRARNALGPHAGLIATVRGIGLRLDATVILRKSSGSAGLPSAPESRRFEREATPRRGVRPALFPLAAMLVVATVFFWPEKTAPETILQGYGITADAILGEQPDTAAMIKEAFKSDAQGERARGAKLLEAVHRSDASTPIPALFLALWSGGTGNSEAERQWLEQARQRMGSRRDLYLNLLLDYVTAESGSNPKEIIDAAGAVLDVRPAAWRMRLARAHLLEFSGMREAALHEIKQIQVTQFGDRKLDQAIADRASFGDVAGAQALLDAIPVESDPATHAFISGRIAWSRGDFDAAFKHFNRTLELAYPVARLDLYRRALLYGGAISALQGRDDEAIAMLERSRLVNEGKSVIDAVDVALFLAQLHHAAGRDELAAAELETALNGAGGLLPDSMHLASAFTALRLQPGRKFVKPAAMSAEYDSLWRAMVAYAANDQKSARAALGEARVRGIGFTRMADEARWLEWQLGEPVSTEAIIDPPYPPLSRFMPRREIRTAQQSLSAEESVASSDRKPWGQSKVPE